MTQHWLSISRDELNNLYDSAFGAMREDWNDQKRAMRHFMNGVLFFQLSALRDEIEKDNVSDEQAEQSMLEDRCLGYLFGLAANYIDLCELPRQSADARAALLDVHVFTFGEDEGTQIAAAQSTRLDLNPLFAVGMEQAHKDANSFKRVMRGAESVPHEGLAELILATITERC